VPAPSALAPRASRATVRSRPPPARVANGEGARVRGGVRSRVGLPQGGLADALSRKAARCTGLQVRGQLIREHLLAHGADHLSLDLSPLKTRRLGMDRMANCAARSCNSSTFTFTILSFPAISVATSSSVGAIALQGPHTQPRNRPVPESVSPRLRLSSCRW